RRSACRWARRRTWHPSRCWARSSMRAWICTRRAWCCSSVCWAAYHSRRIPRWRSLRRCSASRRRFRRRSIREFLSHSPIWWSGCWPRSRRRGPPTRRSWRSSSRDCHKRGSIAGVRGPYRDILHECPIAQREHVRDDVGDVLRMELGRIFSRRLPSGIPAELGEDLARIDLHHTYVVLAQFRAPDIGEPRERELARCVGGAAGAAALPGCGRHVDDVAVALLHEVARRVAGHEHGAEHIGFPDVAEISGRHVDERRESAEAGVVDEGVVAAELADDGRDEARDIGFTAHIGFDGRGADFFRGSAERGDMASADRHTRAGGGEAFGGGIADAGTAAGDEYS